MKKNRAVLAFSAFALWAAGLSPAEAACPSRLAGSAYGGLTINDTFTSSLTYESRSVGIFRVVFTATTMKISAGQGFFKNSNNSSGSTLPADVSRSYSFNSATCLGTTGDANTDQVRFVVTDSGTVLHMILFASRNGSDRMVEVVQLRKI